MAGYSLNMDVGQPATGPALTKGNAMTAFEYAVSAIAAVGFMPIAIVAISAAAKSAKRRQRDEMLDRFYRRIY
jgi:hypothetical protein